jgi:hypothetical protein
MKTRLAAFLLLATVASANADAPRSIPDGKIAHTIHLDALPDRDLIGSKVDIYARRMSNNSAQSDLLTLVVKDAILVASPQRNEWGAETRQATFAIDPKDVKRLKKFEKKVGSSLIVRAEVR